LIEKYKLGNHLWAKGFFVSTAGYISEDTVKRYIEKQKQQDRIHQWNKAHPTGRQGQLGG
jgi:REP element-mobilizing transposase RayT